MKNTASAPPSRPSAPLYQSHGPCVRRKRVAGPVQSITRAEIDRFWRRRKLEEEERRLADEKEAITAKRMPGTFRYELASRIGGGKAVAHI